MVAQRRHAFPQVGIFDHRAGPPVFFRKCPLGPTGPRNLMKIAQRQARQLVTLTPLISARLDLPPRVFRPCCCFSKDLAGRKSFVCNTCEGCINVAAKGLKAITGGDPTGSGQEHEAIVR
jgi:hypothetical protein